MKVFKHLIEKLKKQKNNLFSEDKLLKLIFRKFFGFLYKIINILF